MSENNKKRIWITWEIQRRNKSLSKAVGAELFEIISAFPRYIRYPLNVFKTLSVFILQNPDIIFVQNPSFLLATVAILVGKITGTRVIVDSHNSGIFPLEGQSRFLNGLAMHLIKLTDITLVSNRHLFEYINNAGGHALIVPDPLPAFEYMQDSNNKPVRRELLFICTWAKDEPYNELIKAARLIDGDLKIYVTGNYKSKTDVIIHELPGNVILTGYLSDSDYKKMLSSCDVVIDLTTRENCLVCGAYEAVAMEKPLILSDTIALREYFYQGAIYTNNNADDIANAIAVAYLNIDRLNQEVLQLKSDININWQKYLHELEFELDK